MDVKSWIQHILLFSKPVLDIKMRLVVTVELGTKCMPNSDSASNFMPEYKVLGYWDLPYSFYGHLKITRFFKNYMDFPYENKSGGNFSRKFIFIWRSHIKISYKSLRYTSTQKLNCGCQKLDPTHFTILEAGSRHQNEACGNR